MTAAVSAAVSAAVPAVRSPPLDTTHPLARGSRISTVLLVVALFAAGVLAGGYAVGALAPPRIDRTLAGLQRIDAPGMSVLRRRQQALDLIAAPHGREFVRASLRRLLYVGSAASTLYAARDVRHRLCLVATQLDGSQYAASCATSAVAAATGIRLKWSLTTWAAEQPISDNGYLPRFATAVWGQDDSVRLQVRAQGEGP